MHKTFATLMKQIKNVINTKTYGVQFLPGALLFGFTKVDYRWFYNNLDPLFERYFADGQCM